MSRLMLINGHHAEELRVAIVKDGILESYQVEVAEAGLERGNIYRGVVANIETSLDAAFIDYGNEKHGFLAAHDVIRAAHHRQLKETQRRPRIDDVLEKGRSILVQVTRDGIGRKGAALTTNLSIPGRYVVVMPFESFSGISRKIDDEAVRKEMRERIQSLPIPEGWGYIVRTSAVNQTKTALKNDLAGVVRLCRRVVHEGKRGKNVRLLYDDQDLVVQALRDYLDSDVDEIVIDDEKLWSKAESYVQATMPRSKISRVHYQGRVPLFTQYDLEPQIDSIYQRVVRLSAGGSIVIDNTEALTAIDVNSGRDTRGNTQEETALNTNLAAADEVARQLRLRDIGGLVVVDFIDMRLRKNRAAVEKAVKDALKRDKARTSISRLSANGLLEINRQRLRKALVQRSHRICPTCQGVGLFATPELLGLRLLRRIEARAATGRLQRVRVELHPELADAIQNQRRRQLAAIELEFGITIEINAVTHLHRSEERIEWKEREPTSDQHVAVADIRETSQSKGKRKSNKVDYRPLAITDTTEYRFFAAAENSSIALNTVEATDSSSGLEKVEGKDEGPDGRSKRKRRRPRRRRKQPDEAVETESVPEKAAAPIERITTEPDNTIAGAAIAPVANAAVVNEAEASVSAEEQPKKAAKSTSRRRRGGARRAPQRRRTKRQEAASDDVAGPKED